MAYISAANMRNGTLYPFIDVPDSYTDARLDILIGAAAGIVDAYCNDHFEPTAGVVRVRGRNATFLEIPKRVRGVSSVSLYDYADTLTTIPATYYQIHSTLDVSGANVFGLSGRDGLSLRQGLSGFWPRQPYYVDVTGAFDWPATPEEVKHATALIVWTWTTNQFPPDVQVIDSATQRWTRFPPNADSTGVADADRVLQRFRRLQFGLSGV